MEKIDLTRLPASSSVDDVVSVIERDGGVIIENYLDSAALADLKADLDRVLNETPGGDEDFFVGTNTRRAGRIFARTSKAVDVALHPLYLGAARALLQRPINVWYSQSRNTVTPDIQLGMTQAIQIGAGQGQQPLHRDDTVFMWRHPQYGREARLQIMLAVTDFTAENGGTRVIPGSHLWDDERMPLEEEAMNTVMPAGSALLFLGSVYHGGGQNVTDVARTGLTMSYDLHFLRQEENQYLSIPLETVRELPEEMQKLLGWATGEGFMGWVEVDGKMQDPMVLLERADFRSPAELSSN